MIAEPTSTLESALEQWFGYPAFRPGQREIVAAAVDGDDLLALLPTGGGKSICYQLPALMGNGLTLVVSPLVALMKDQIDGLPAAARPYATWIGSALPTAERESRMRLLSSDKLRLVYAAPERLRSADFVASLSRRGLERIVVDEAHCISEWGHEFRPDYRAIGRLVEGLAPRHVMAVTATATERVRNDIESRLGRRLRRFLRPAHRGNLHLAVERLRSESEKISRLRIAVANANGQGLVYASSRRKCEQLASLLESTGRRSGFYHAGLVGDERSRAQDRFMEGKLDVMVATVAFGMGVDKPDIRWLIHFQPSRSLENYTQEAGRAGRDGLPAWCLLLATPADLRPLSTASIETDLTLDNIAAVYRELRFRARHRRLELDWDSALGDSMAVHLWQRALPVLEEVGLLRRHADLVGSAASGDVEPDQSLHEPVDSPRPGEQVRTGLSRRVDIEIMVPPEDARGHLERLLTERRQHEQVRRRAMSEYIRVDRCRHGRIAHYYGDAWERRRCGRCDHCGGSGGPRREQEVHGIEIPPECTPGSSASAAEAGSRLEKELVKWRRETAACLRVPAFVVLPNSVMTEICHHRPRTLSELGAIRGMGCKRVDQYGEVVLAKVREYGGPT